MYSFKAFEFVQSALLMHGQSGWGERATLLVVHGLVTAVGSLVAEHRL